MALEQSILVILFLLCHDPPTIIISERIPVGTVVERKRERLEPGGFKSGKSSGLMKNANPVVASSSGISGQRRRVATQPTRGDRQSGLWVFLSVVRFVQEHKKKEIKGHGFFCVHN